MISQEKIASIAAHVTSQTAMTFLVATAILLAEKVPSGQAPRWQDIVFAIGGAASAAGLYQHVPGSGSRALAEKEATGEANTETAGIAHVMDTEAAS